MSDPQRLIMHSSCRHARAQYLQLAKGKCGRAIRASRAVESQPMREFVDNIHRHAAFAH